MSDFDAQDTPVLLTDGDLVYTVLTPKLKEEAYDIIVDSFSDEPSSMHLESDRSVRMSQWKVFAAFFADECASNCSSIVCIDVNEGNVAGVFWARDFMLDLPDDFSVKGLTCIEPVVEVLTKLDDSYHELRPNMQKGECVDMWMLGVSPNYRKRGIAGNLVKVTKDWLSDKGFSRIVLEASGGFSAKCAEKAGMKAIVQKFYAEENKIFEGIPDCHSVMQLYEFEI